MLAYVLAWVVGLGSLGIYSAAFFFPEIHRKNDFIWSGIGFFYALVLWVYAERLSGGILLGQAASVSLLVSFGWQTLQLRRALTPSDQQTPLPALPTQVGGITSNLQKRLANLPLRRTSVKPSQQAVTPAAQPEQVQKMPGATQATQPAIPQPSLQTFDRTEVEPGGTVESRVIPLRDFTSKATTEVVPAHPPSAAPPQQVRPETIAGAPTLENAQLEVEEDLWATPKAPGEVTTSTPKTQVAKSVAVKDNLQSKLANLPVPVSLPKLKEQAGSLFTRIKDRIQETLSKTTQRSNKPSAAPTQKPVTSTLDTSTTAANFDEDPLEFATAEQPPIQAEPSPEELVAEEEILEPVVTDEAEETTVNLSALEAEPDQLTSQSAPVAMEAVPPEAASVEPEAKPSSTSGLELPEDDSGPKLGG